MRLAPVQAYDEFWQRPIEKDPFEVPLEEKIAAARGATSAAMQKTHGVLFATAQAGFKHEWKFLATSEGSFIEQVLLLRDCGASATARTGGQVKTRTYSRAARRAATSS